MREQSIRLGPDIGGRSYLVTGGHIVDPQPTSEETVPQSPRNLDCFEARVLPGKVNAHTHLYSGLVPLGMPTPTSAPTNFLEILERIWWRLDRALDPEILRAAARYYVSESLFSGTTTLVDHHESPNCIEGSLDVLADACDELGMRALLCYGATERNGGREEGRRGLQECRRFLEENKRGRVLGMVGLHASFTVSDETIIEAAGLCREMGASLHVHMAEDLADIRDAESRGYSSPFHRLYRLGALRPGSILAHGVHLRQAAVEKACEESCWLVHNPRSNEGNAVGYAGVLSAGDRVALGTDGFPSDMAVEAAALERLAAAHVDTEVSAIRRMEAGAQLVGAHFGWDALPLEAGSVADLAVFAAGGVRHLLVGGVPVIENGELQTGDREAIRQEAEVAAGRLWLAMAAL